MSDQLSVTEQLMYSTVRLKVTYEDGSTGTGTSFIVGVHYNEEASTHVPILITNKHVIKDASTLQFVITQADDEGNPLHGTTYAIEFTGVEFGWKLHPDDNVDLCATPFMPIEVSALTHGAKLFYRTLYFDLFVSEEQLLELTAVENILMVGYPIGLWDRQNNLPIFRRGVTASHPRFDHNGKPDFLIDAACYPGSSGSPVFWYDRGAVPGRSSTRVGERIAFLGVLHSGPQMTAEGEIVVRPVPTASQAIAQTRVMVNLGYVVKAAKVRELETLFPKPTDPQSAD